MYQHSNSSPLGSQCKEDEQPVTKAGIIFYERTRDQKGYPCLNIVYGRSNRYGQGMYNCLPKGGIEDQTPLAGGEREAGEETGIWLSKVLGAENYARLVGGETIHGKESPHYKGVSVIHASPEPVSDHTYISRHGRRFRMQFFAVEVKGLDALAGELKHIPSDAGSWNLPTFNECLGIIRSGVVKAGKNPWQGDKAVRLFDAPALPALEQAYYPISTQGEWQKLCDTAKSADYKHLKSQLEIVKAYFEEKGLIGDSGQKPKFDISDQPLNFYWEEGAIGRASDMLRESLEQAGRSPIYDAVMWGRSIADKHKGRSEEEIVSSAEIAGLTEFLAVAAPMELAAAGIKAKGAIDHRIVELVGAQVPPASCWSTRVQEAPVSAKGQNR